MGTKLPAVAAKKASEITPHLELSDGAKPLLKPDMAPGDFLDALLAVSLHADAVTFLAHGLGRREAVWWACVCCKQTMESSPPPGAEKALAAAEAWCYQPTEPNRRAAHAAAEASGYKHPAAWAAMGAFWSGGSMAPPHVPQPVPPGPFLTAKAVSSAIILSAVRFEPTKAPERYKEFVAQGVKIANAPPAGKTA